MTPEIERRGFATELRAKGRRLEGYAATFDTPAKIGGRFVETIAKGAFAASLRRGGDVLALVDHDPGKLLARTGSRTLRLCEDSQGLAFDLDVPDTAAGRDVLALAERGDLGGASFGFHAVDQARDGDRRELRAVELLEISVICAWPAYPGTVVEARSVALPAPRRAALGRWLQIWGVRA